MADQPDGVGLARRLASGDQDAIRDTYRAYGRLVFTVTLRVLGDRRLAEEASQAAFVKLWRAAARIDPERDVRPLLCTIARRCAFDLSTHEHRRAASPLDETTAGTVHDDGLERTWTAWRVREALDQLPADEAAVMRLQYLEELTHQEIANRIEVPIGTVKSRSFRAHKRLTSLLRDVAPDWDRVEVH